MRRVVITGMGVVSAIGTGAEEFGRSLAEGVTRTRIAEFDETPYLRSPKNFLDRNSAFAFAACEMAVRGSGATLPAQDENPGLAVGSFAGNSGTLALFHSRMLEKGPKLAPPFLWPHTYYNATAGLLAIEYGLEGPHGQFCSAGAAGLEAVAWAADLVARGATRLMIAGGVEALTPALSPGAADRHPRGEGAAFFVLEEGGRAEARGADARGVLAGWALAGSPVRSMVSALDISGVTPDDVDVVFAAGDAEEEAAIAEVFDDVPVARPKAFFGEALGATGALGLAAAIAAMERNVLPGSRARRESDMDRIVVNAGAGRIWCSVVVGRVR